MFNAFIKGFTTFQPRRELTADELYCKYDCPTCKKEREKPSPSNEEAVELKIKEFVRKVWDKKYPMPMDFEVWLGELVKLARESK